MPDLLPSASFRADFTVLSLPIPDLIGSQDSDGSAGAPTLDGISCTLDGIDDKVLYSTVNQPVNPTAKHTQARVFNYLDTIAGAGVETIFGPNPNGFAPTMNWIDSSPNFKTFGINVNNQGPDSLRTVMPRLINSAEKIGYIYTYDPTTRETIHLIKSNQGLNKSGSNIDSVGGVVSRGVVIGANGIGTVFTSVRHFEHYAWSGLFTNLTDMNDTLNELLGIDPSGEKIGRNFRKRLIYNLANPFNRFKR